MTSRAGNGVESSSVSGAVAGSTSRVEHVGCFVLGERKAVLERYLLPDSELTPKVRTHLRGKEVGGELSTAKRCIYLSM